MCSCSCSVVDWSVNVMYCNAVEGSVVQCNVVW